MSFSWKGVFTGIVKDAEAVKAEVVKIADDVPGVLVKLEKDAPVAEDVANAFLPGSGDIINIGLELAEGVADVLEAGGAAAEQNLINSGFDSALIAKLKALAAQIKSLKS
jgi:hypothetical protein